MCSRAWLALVPTALLPADRRVVRKLGCHGEQLVMVPRPQIELWGQCPPIEKMDGSLAALKACK